MSQDIILVQFISASCFGKMLLGRPNISTRHSMLNNICKIIPNDDHSCSFSKWVLVVHDGLLLPFLIHNLGTEDQTFIPDCDGSIPTSPPMKSYQFPPYS